MAEKKIGIVIAVENAAVRRLFGAPLRRSRCGGFRLEEYVRHGSRLYVLSGCAGEIAAASGTQALISVTGAELIVSLGISGGLTAEMQRGTLCIVDSVVHYDFDASAAGCEPPGRYPFLPDEFIPVTGGIAGRAAGMLPEARRVVCASGDSFAADRQTKAALNLRYGADICEMEAAGVLLTARRNRVPCLILKTVADSLSGGLAECEDAAGTAADTCVAAFEHLLSSNVI